MIWEAKVVAAAAETVETNRKHEVTRDRGAFISRVNATLFDEPT